MCQEKSRRLSWLFGEICDESFLNSKYIDPVTVTTEILAGISLTFLAGEQLALVKQKNFPDSQTW